VSVSVLGDHGAGRGVAAGRGAAGVGRGVRGKGTFAIHLLVSEITPTKKK
jgi:hypothetical protein